MPSPSSVNQFESLFAQHRTAAIPDLWPWQRDVLAEYEPLTDDAAVELPTGTGKTLIGFLAGEDFRQGEGGPVAYLAGNNSLNRLSDRLGLLISPSCGSRDPRRLGPLSTSAPTTSGARSGS